MRRAGLQSVGAGYQLTYETRDESEAYLASLDPARRSENIDFAHLYGAYECIAAWFDAHGHRRQHVANQFYGALFEQVQVIWYEVPASPDEAIDLFTRLNVGRIPLTDAELLKAVLLMRGDAGADRRNEIASQWDIIERDLNDPDVWAFISDQAPASAATRISLLLDVLAGGEQGKHRAPLATFTSLLARIEDTSRQEVWNDILDLHGTILGWYRNPSTYHKIGYLVAVGRYLLDIARECRGRSKTEFDAVLDGMIRDSLRLSPSALRELSYEQAQHRDKCERILLLFNVETTRRRQSGERYSFRHHHRSKWSLEHIHAQNADALTTAEQWAEWLRLHLEALTDSPFGDASTRNTLLARIQRAELDLSRPVFQAIAREVTAFFAAGEAEGGAEYSLHSISNLALLSSGDNAALSNSVFEVKRRQLLQLDREGKYIPICTRNVFLKYYTLQASQQLHFWSLQDRRAYLDRITSATEGVGRYLQPEDQA